MVSSDCMYVAKQRNMHASNIAFLYLFAVMCDELFQLINPRFLDMKMKLCRNQNKKKAKLWKENIHDIMLNFISASRIIPLILVMKLSCTFFFF